jgi:diguanylate cyclase (GGDEF)-like protein
MELAPSEAPGVSPSMQTLNVLLIDDSDHDATQLVRELSAAGYRAALTRVATADALVTALTQQSWDLVCSDFSLASMSGADALALVRQRGVDVPFIFVSGVQGEDAAVEAMRLGAQDFVTKTNVGRVRAAVDEALRTTTERRARAREHERVAYLAFHDELTDLPNRTLFHDRLHQALLESRRERRPLALLMIDLDGFKEINDTLGHHAGDQVLQIVAGRLRALLRQSDTIARLGGDEFAVLLRSTDSTGAELAADKVLQEIERPMVLDGRPVFVRGSVGIASFPEHGAAEQELLQKADVAMYVAKNDRCGMAIYSADRDGRADRRVVLVASMWQGLDEGQFSLEYQPIVSLRTGDTVALEALLRWDHPQYGRISPEQFIPLAEQSGFITRLTLFAIERALAEWPCADGTMSVAVNVSPRSLQDSAFPAMVRDVLDRLRASKSALALEITENLVMSDVDRAVQCLNELHAMGIKLVIDDFGTGYSSLSHLRRLPVSQLKIDRSFVVGLVQGEDDALVRSIIALAHNLRLETVAEGVDSLELRDRLRDLGCDAVQGHFINPPAPAPVMAERLMQRDRSRCESV